MYRLLLLAKIKENKVYFGKLVTFLGEGGGLFTPTDPLDPLEGVSRGQPAQKISKGGWGVSPNFKSRGGGSDPLGPPYGHLCLKLYIVLLRAKLTCFIRSSLMG